MKSIVSLAVFFSAVFLALAPIATAAVPIMMQYQGFLTDDSGEPLDTMVDMTFTIYDASTGSGVIWTETQDTVTVSNGLFHVLLGSVNPIVDTVFTSTQRWLGITVDPDPEVVPRTRLVTVPYAFRVATLDGASGGVISGDVDIQSDLTVSGKATIGPGHTNTGVYAFIAGESNTASGDESTVGGGSGNIAGGFRSTISGGENNSADTAYATVAGGATNTASGERSSIGGGVANTASRWASTISGGFENTAGGAQSTVGGGGSNVASGDCSTVGGGCGHLVAGANSVIPGGNGDTITSEAWRSMVFGEGVYLNTPDQVVFFNSTYSGKLGINRDDHDGGIDHPIHVGTSVEDGNGAYLSADGQWHDASSKTFKTDFHPLEGEEILTQISNLLVESWRYKGTQGRHVGPYAEDFAEAFGVGTLREDGTVENQYLAPSDVAGVALAGVKELTQQNQELRQIIEQLRESNVLLEARIAELEKAK